MKVVAIALLVLGALVGCDKPDPKVEQRKMVELARVAEDVAREAELRQRGERHHGTFTKIVKGNEIVYVGSLNWENQPDGPGEFRWPGGVRIVGEYKDGEMLHGAMYNGSEFFSTITPESLRQAREGR